MAASNPFPLSRDDLLQCYRTMRTIREFEERLHVDFARGDIPGFVHLYAGEEATAVGIMSHLGDGDRIASSQSANAGRTFEFEQASLNNIETIEVTKAPTPDMDADSIGGNVNIVSKSAFDRNQPRTFNYSIGGVWRPRRISPAFSSRPRYWKGSSE